MESMKDLGERVRMARLRGHLSVSEAAAGAKIARDTWVKIEEGKSVQDAKRQAALDFLSLPTDPTVTEPQADTGGIEPRLSGIERQLADLWRKVDAIDARTRERGGVT